MAALGEKGGKAFRRNSRWTSQDPDDWAHGALRENECVISTAARQDHATGCRRALRGDRGIGPTEDDPISVVNHPNSRQAMEDADLQLWPSSSIRCSKLEQLKAESRLLPGERKVWRRRALILIEKNEMAGTWSAMICV